DSRSVGVDYVSSSLCFFSRNSRLSHGPSFLSVSNQLQRRVERLHYAGGHAASALVLSEVWLDHGQLSIPVVLLGWICVAFYRRLLIDGSFAFARGASRLVRAGRAHC